jgi:small nuclear ribonucleoprotein (snRNP)-like protein
MIWRRSYIRKLTRQRVIVHTRDDQSIRGVLKEVHPDCIVITAAQYLDKATTEDVSGTPVIPRENVAWLQVLSDAGS